MRLGLAVQVVRHFGFPVDMVQPGAVIFCVRQCIVANYYARCFYQPTFNCIVQAEVRYDPIEQSRLGQLVFPVGANGVADKSKQRCTRRVL